MKKSHSGKSATVSASELAQMGVCERLVVFEHRFGKRFSPEQEQAVRRGLNSHRRFYQEAVRAKALKRRCFISTLVFGESIETQTLRSFRDQVLRNHALGRLFIYVYYRTAPSVCRILEHRPWAILLTRLLLRMIVGAIRWFEYLKVTRTSGRLPAELARAQLLYAEETFRSTGTISIVARCDRAYMTRSGFMVLVELKTRPINRVYPSDIIELSAQRVAMQGQTGSDVALHGYVLIQMPGKADLLSHRVDLLSAQAVSDLAKRRELILSGKDLPRYPRSKGICAKCRFVSACWEQ